MSSKKQSLAIDGGALCAPGDKRFGTYSVSVGIISELQNTPREYGLEIYGFDDRLLYVVEVENARILRPSLGWQAWRVPLEQLMHPTDWYLALNQSIPVYVSGKIMSLSHGLSFMKYPALYPDSYERLKRQVEMMVKRSAVILVSSKRVRQEFDELFPGHGRIEIVMFGVLSSSGKERSDAEPGIHVFDGLHLDSRLRGNDNLGVGNDNLGAGNDKRYILTVGMDHQIKNYGDAIRIVEKVRETDPGYLLVIVGAGNRRSADPKWLVRIPYADAEELAALYSGAHCLLTTSLYESFNLPVLESLSYGTPVVGYESAIIPELKKYARVVESVDEAAEMILKRDFVHVPKREELEKKFSWQLLVRKLAVILGQGTK